METGSLHLTTQSYQGQEVDFDVPYLAFPTNTGRIIVHAPGTGESHEGRRGRYRELGQYLADQGIASLVTFKPPLPDAEYKYPQEPYSYKDASWNRIYVQSMARIVIQCSQDALAICGSAAPALAVSGFSSGGSVAGAVASLFPHVDKLLLLSAYDSVADLFYQGLKGFHGEIYAVTGENDPPAIVIASMLASMAPSAASVTLRSVTSRGHGLDEQVGDSYLTRAFLWAFAGQDSLPAFVNPFAR